MKHQFRGIRFIEKMKGVCLIGDDMGVGKTLEVLGWMAIHSAEITPTIICCPANAKYVWEGQIQEHTYMDCQVLSGKKPYTITSNIVIINYDILPYWEKQLLELRAKLLVIDECQYIKTRKIRRTKICKMISRKAKFRIPMSGTPIISRPIEFFSALNIVQPKEFGSFWKYAFRYCGPKKGFQGRGWDFSGATRIPELHKRVSSVMIRRMKKDVLKYLPPKRRIPIIVDLDNHREYQSAKHNFLSWYEKEYGSKKAKKAKKGLSFVRLGQLRRLAAKGKFKAACQWIDDFLEETNEKLVVFCYHREILEQLKERYANIAAIGGKSGRKRDLEVKRFQKDKKVRLFLGTIRADKEAITLTAASTTFFIEQGWTPGEHDQAEDRVNRIGQAALKITAYYLLAKNTIDEYVWNLIEDKRKLIARIMDGETVAEKLKERISLVSLIKHLNKKERKKAT